MVPVYRLGDSLMLISIEREHDTTLTKQVYEQIRSKILQKELKECERLPSTRELARTLGISRNITIEAYDQLVAEGYLVMKPRSGAFVARGLSLQMKQDDKSTSSTYVQANLLSQDTIDFRTGNPAMDHFPRKIWGKLAKSVCEDSPNSIFGYSSPKGIEELRHCLVDYLLKNRGVRCNKEQIVITSGATQALSIITSLLSSPNSYVAVEDPVTDEMRNIFISCGALIKPIPVDEFGILPDYLSQKEKPSFLFVIPSHQFPLGGTLPIQRRIQLIEYARRMNCYIVEDDYDSEFTYEGNPVHSLQGLDSKNVIYVGTFSKILSPSLRIGYVVLPTELMDSFCHDRWFKDRHSSTLEQLILTRFIDEGYFDRHVRKMKKIYQKRRRALVDQINVCFNSPKILGQAAGMHLVVEFKGLSLLILLCIF
jgi:GntR family transcriptional regulator / MocR family aminotransferase